MIQEFTKVTVEQSRRPMPIEWHGRVMRVGRRFIRVVFPELPKFWENDNDGVVKTDRGWKEYRLMSEGSERIMKIIGY